MNTSRAGPGSAEVNRMIVLSPSVFDHQKKKGITP